MVKGEEWQADLFALHFCIPTFMLQKLSLPSDSKRAIYKTSKKFGVTYEFAEKLLYMYNMKLLDLEVHSYSKW